MSVGCFVSCPSWTRRFSVFFRSSPWQWIWIGNVVADAVESCARMSMQMQMLCQGQGVRSIMVEGDGDDNNVEPAENGCRCDNVDVPVDTDCISMTQSW